MLSTIWTGSIIRMRLYDLLYIFYCVTFSLHVYDIIYIYIYRYKSHSTSHTIISLVEEKKTFQIRVKF